MGGKNKQAQRTKNNVRPSSSGRSAELLGNTAPAFVGFTAVKDGGFVPVLPGFTVTTAEEFDLNLNPNFHLVLKKMGKKDSITKLKALQEFSELIRNSEPEAVKTVLPLWPRLYCHLAVDVEHRVREAAHQAQRAVVLRAKRNLAPYLRQLAGPWFTSQYDTYPPAATAASQAFQEAFPPNKVIEAIIFCQEQILTYIYDNLIVQTAQTLSNPTTVTAEEMEAKYQRVVISSLQGYALYLQKLPADQLKAAEQANKKFLVSKKFWKLSKHSCALIRNAWFTVIIALCQKAPDLLADEGSRVALAVFSNLDENDPIVLPTVWEASLHVLTTIEDCWQHVNAEKLVLPKLWHILREGGQGNASEIFPNLLPFISKIPSTVCSNKQEFYDKFFSSMRQGMNQKSVLQSCSECVAVAKGYVECLQYIIMLHLNDINFCQSILKNHLAEAIALVLKNQKLHLVSSALFPQVSGLVYHWNHNCDNEGYNKLAEEFWKTLTDILIGSLSPSSEDSLKSESLVSSWFLNRQVDLCISLKNPKLHRISQKLKVKFSTQDNEHSDENSKPGSPVDNEHFNTEELPVDQGLHTLVQALSALYFKKFEESSDTGFLVSLTRLTDSFRSRDLFLNLLHANISVDIQTNEDSLLELYNTTLCKWLENENMCSEDVVSITFSLLEFLSPEEKDHILESLCKVCNESVLMWCVKSSLQHRSDPNVQKWLNSQQLSNILVTIAHDICLRKTAIDAENVLKCCLSKTKNGELVISTETFSAILLEFSEKIKSDKNNPCIGFVNELVTSLYSDDIRLSPYLHPNTAAEELLLSLFRLSCNRREENKAWCVGVSALARLLGSCSENFIQVTLKFSQIIKEELLSKEDISIELIDHITSTVIVFLQAAVNCFPADVEENSSLVSTSIKLCAYFLSSLSSVLDDKARDLTVICMCAEQMKGLLNFSTKCVTESNRSSIVNSEIEIVQYMILLVFSVTLVSKLPDSWNIVEVEDNVEEKRLQRISDDDIHYLKNHLLTIVYSIGICESFSRHYKSSLYYYKMYTKYSDLLQRFELLMKTLDDKALECITSITVERTKKDGGMWLQVLYLLHTKFLKQTDLSQLYEDLISNSENISAADVHQVFLSYVKVEDMKTDVTSLDVDKLTMVACWLRNLDGTLPIEYSDSICNLLDSVLNWHKQDHKAEHLFDCKVQLSEAKAAAATSRFLAAVIEKCPELLTADHWDAIIISVADKLSMKYSQNLLLCYPATHCLPLVSTRETQSADTSMHHSTSTSKPLLMENLSGSLLVVAVFELYKSLSVFFTTPRTENDSLVVRRFHEKLSVEWKDVFADDVHDVLIHIFSTISGLVETQPPSLFDLPLLESLGEAILLIDSKYFFVSETKNNSNALDGLVQNCCHVIHSSVIPLQLTAFHIFTRLVPGLIELDTPAAFAASAVDKEGEGLSLNKLQKTLVDTQTVVDTMLLGIRLGNSCTTVCPCTDAYTYSTAYLLLWVVVLDMCGKAVSELRYQYATMLRDSGFLKSLLENLFRLMPEEVLYTTDPKFKLQKTSEMFSSPPSLEYSKAYSSEMLEHLSCWVYCNTLRRLPALVREWWSDMDSRVASLVDHVTSTHCSPVLCAEEMKSIQSKDAQHGNMVVKVHPSVREVVAIYKVDESRMEMSVHLPNNYPLGPVRVDSGNQLVESGQWRNWIMQLTVFLIHQNGSIWDGLTLWKRNLDKKFEGVEECYICFSILHGTNFQIPRQCCSTCKKKFHSQCLYKWFSTSNKATCPICRNLF